MDVVRRHIQKYFLTSHEESLIALGKVLVETAECFTGYGGSKVTEITLPGYQKSDRLALGDIYVRHGSYVFGYIHNVEIDIKEKYLQIGHIATKTEYMGYGLGIRFVVEISRIAKRKYGVNRVYFCETSSKRKIACYQNFFKYKLRAIPNGDSWVWNIPKYIC